MPKPNGMTAAEILSKTTSRTKQAARYVNVLSAEPKVLRGGFNALKCKTNSTHDPDGNPKPEQKKHTTVVYATEEGVRLHKALLKVSCTCEAHVFGGGEYALWKRGAADIKYGNGEAPTIRNPKNVPWACKHLVRVLAGIIRRKV